MKPLPNLIMIKGEQHLKIKAIVDSLTDQGKTQYPIAWKAFSPSETECVNSKHVKAS